ncbi:MAG: amino acid ABC transporter permease [Proteobacteria bacterium]|nr:amino acid ABC transporter permease [Pseudomonadota bacterium]
MQVEYVFQFGVIWQGRDAFLSGALLTLQLSAESMLLGVTIGILGAWAKTSRLAVLRGVVQAYVELVRNTPFLVQLLLIYFGLPRLGVRMSPDSAALLAMVINLGAYATEIVRAGVEAVPHGQIEAGRALGLRSWQIFRFVVLIPALETVFPALCSQFILVMLGSSVVSAISVEELTAIANTLQSQTFRPFEIYLAVGAIYVVIALAFEAAFGGVERILFPPKGASGQAPS